MTIKTVTLMKHLEDTARQSLPPKEAAPVAVPLVPERGGGWPGMDAVASFCVDLGNSLEAQGFARHEAVYLIGCVIPKMQEGH